MFTVWHSTEEFADFLIANTMLKNSKHEQRQLVESDGAKPKLFHAIPTHLKQILYLDAPDVIIEHRGTPILAIEISSEAGTGHNVFQRFGRIAAAAERGVPVFYIYPEAVYVNRKGSNSRYDALNPLIFNALENLMRVFDTPCFIYLFPSGYPSSPPPFKGGDEKGLRRDPKWRSCPLRTDNEMQMLFRDIDSLLKLVLDGGKPGDAMKVRDLRQRHDWIKSRAFPAGYEGMSPRSSTLELPTKTVLAYLRKFAGSHYDFGHLLPSREKTIVYKLDANFRGDPYPGALAALDYMLCRHGRTYEDRNLNLAMAWGAVTVDAAGKLLVAKSKEQTIEDFTKPIRDLYKDKSRVLLWKKYADLRPHEVSRYYMQVRFGTTFTKRKDLRMYSYFADAILFPDGALWREG